MAFYGGLRGELTTRKDVTTAGKILLFFGVVFGLIMLFCLWLMWTEEDARKSTQSMVFAIIFGVLTLMTSSAAAYNFHYTRTMSHAPVMSIALSNPMITVAVIIAVIMAATGGLAYLIIHLKEAQDARQSAETPAKIIAVDVESASGKNGGLLKVVRYTYTVDNRNYEAVSRVSSGKDFEPGAVLKTCYNPSNPKDSTIRQLQYRCGS